MSAADPDSCAAKLRVLSDPTRLQVMRILGVKPRLVGELREVLKIEQSLLSHHLKVLRDSGLVQSGVEGQNRRYSIVSDLTHGGAVDLGCCQITFADSSL